MSENAVPRRAFLGVTAATALSYSRVMRANERIQLGIIGCGERGRGDLGNFVRTDTVNLAAVCDIYETNAEAGKKVGNNPSAKMFTDHRKLLETPGLDAVLIAVPDHWHSRIAIDALNAGKDVYVEKPLSLTVAEGRRMVQVAAATNRVTQVGIHRRSAKFLAEAAEFVRSGGIGRVTVAKGFHVLNEWPKGVANFPAGPPPNGSEWDQWLGPAPKVPYNKARTYYTFRWFYDYSGGQMTNFGVHYMDMLRWCLGQDAPRAVTAMGGKYAIEDSREIPDTAEALWQFDGPTLMVFTQYNANAAPANAQSAEMEIRGTKGTMYLHNERWEVVPEKITDQNIPARTPLDRVTERSYRPSRKPAMEPKSGKGSSDTAFHARNFLDCVKTRARCNCDVLTGHQSTSATLIANIALKTRSFLEWDAKAEKFTNNSAANRYLSYEYRSPYKLG